MHDPDIASDDTVASEIPSATQWAGGHGTDDTLHAPMSRSDHNALKRELLVSKMFPAQAAVPSLGRYDVLAFVGEGGMGTVYAAHDPRLDRKVAIKLLRNTSSDVRRRARLVREAKALARLNHANVVTVHEVWDEDGELYIAMEFVEGEDLAHWHRETRPWRDIVDVYLQAGEGLAAVHEAGLVYRDFKPANAIRREDDGVVKLLDFGLARAEDHLATVPDENRAEAALQEGRELGLEPTRDALTRAGAIVGTPAYMAPEQFLGLPADTRSDQYSFAISLWEGLYGQRPFDLSSLWTAALSAPLVDPPSDSDVPAWVQRVLRRALARDPRDRYPSMHALLLALRRDPAVRRRRILSVAATVVATVTGGMLISELRAEPSSACVAVATPWDDQQQRTTRASILQSGDSSAQQTWELLEPRLATYTNALSEHRTNACEAHRRGLQPDDQYAAQVACLDRSAAAFNELVSLLDRADASVIANANKTVTQLPPSATCMDANALVVDYPRPAETAEATKVAELRRQLVRAGVEESTGLYERAADRAHAVLTEAEKLDYPPLEAEARMRLGSAQMQTGLPSAVEQLDEALWISIETEQRRVAAEAAAKRIHVHRDQDGERRGISEVIALARSLGARSGAADWRIQWLLSNNIGSVHDNLDEPSAALDAYEDALARIPEDPVQGRFERATTLMNMAVMQQRLGNIELALTNHRRAIDDITAVFGTAHPQVLETRTMLARTHRVVGHYAQARAILEDVLSYYPEPGSAPPPAVYEIAQVGLFQQDLNDADRWLGSMLDTQSPGLSKMWVEEFSALRAVVAATRGDSSALGDLAERGVAIEGINRAWVLLLLGQPEDAEAILDARLDDPQRMFRYPEFAQQLLGRALVAQRRWNEAKARLDALLESEMFEQNLPALQRSEALQDLATAEHGLGNHSRAAELATRALQTLDGFDRDSVPVRESLALQASLTQPGPSAPADAQPPPADR